MRNRRPRRLWHALNTFNTFGTGFFLGGCFFALMNVLFLLSLSPNQCEPDAERNYYNGFQEGKASCNLIP